MFYIVGSLSDLCLCDRHCHWWVHCIVTKKTWFLRFVWYGLVFDHFGWKFISIYATLTHSYIQTHYFLCDYHRHEWVYHVDITKIRFSGLCYYVWFLFNSVKKLYQSTLHQTQQWTTSMFDINHVIPYSNHQKTRLYQGLADCCEGDLNSDTILPIQPSKTINYCDQLALAIVPDLKIFIWSITIFGLISRIALVQALYITCYVLV